MKPTSPLTICKILFRKSQVALLKGRHEDVSAEGDILSFRRLHENEDVFCAINLSETASHMPMPVGAWTSLAADLGSAVPGADGVLKLAPWQCCFALRQQ